MTELGVESARRNAKAERSFWRRQFGVEPTRAQVHFDIAFGIFIPVLCFIFDPVVFRGSLIGDGVYQKFQFFAYTVSAVEILTLGAWLFAGTRGGARAYLYGGILFAGALFSFVLGVSILPFTLLGLLFFVGVFGFVPFVTALVYLRNGLRALADARSNATRAGGATAFALGAVCVLCVPAATQWSVAEATTSVVNEVRAGKELTPSAMRAMRLATTISGATYDELVWDYEKETDAARRARLAKVYAEITGHNIEQRLARLTD